MLETNGLILKYQVARALADHLSTWDLSFCGRRNTAFHYVFEIQRLHVWAYWRPMTVARFERLTRDYRGPHIPIFASRTQYLDDEEMVYEGYDFCLRRHQYKTVPFYFVCPGFLLQKQWKPEREWRWHPAVRLTPSLMKRILQREDQYGGWRQNSRGRLLVPKRTGVAGVLGLAVDGEGWASFATGDSAQDSSLGERSVTHALSTEFHPVRRAQEAGAHDSGDQQHQSSFEGFEGSTVYCADRD